MPWVPDSLREFRIWWLNASVGDVLLFGAVAILCILAWKSPEIYRVLLDAKDSKRLHERLSKVSGDRIEREQARRLEKNKKE